MKIVGPDWLWTFAICIGLNGLFLALWLISFLLFFFCAEVRGKYLSGWLSYIAHMYNMYEGEQIPYRGNNSIQVVIASLLKRDLL